MNAFNGLQQWGLRWGGRTIRRGRRLAVTRHTRESKIQLNLNQLITSEHLGPFSTPLFLATMPYNNLGKRLSRLAAGVPSLATARLNRALSGH